MPRSLADRRFIPQATIAMIAAACLWGCGSAGDKSVAASRDSTPADAEFERGADKPPTPRMLYAAARILVLQNRDGEAQNVLRRLIREYPRVLPAYCDLAELQMRHDHSDHAMVTLTAALNIDPKDPVLLNNLGMCHLLRDEPHKALERFMQASSAAPGSARYRSNMAAALGTLGRYEEALALYEQVIPSDEAHHNLSVLAQARGDLSRSVREEALARSAAPASRPGASSNKNLSK